MSAILTEGGQITSHRLRMLRQVLKIGILGSFAFGLFVFAIQMYNLPNVSYLAVWYFIKSWMLTDIISDMEVDRSFIFHTLNINYATNPRLPLEYITRLTSPIAYKFLQESYIKLIYSTAASGIFSVFAFCFFFYRGWKSKNKKHLSGPKTVSPYNIALRLKIRRMESPISIGPLPLVKGTETQHMLITGGTGSGKTNCLHHLLRQIRATNKKALIVDTTGDFLGRYYRPGKDILLNPFNQNSVNWSPWAEGCSNTDYAELAESFIPTSQSDSDNYWKLASKTVFISLLQKFSDTKKTSDITRWIQYEPLSNLCRLVEGTKAAAHLDLSSEKTASSIRSVASTMLECLENLRDTDNPFSIKQWFQEDTDSWLFLQCSPSQRAILRPLMSAWISSAIRGLLNLPIEFNRRIWFIMDELPTMQRIKNLETLLTEGRKYGGCSVIVLQSPAQLDNIYGRDVAKVIIGNTATKVIFRESDPEIAERISKTFGEREVMEIQQGISYGAHEARDGVSLSMQNKIRPVVSTTQILELPVNTAYVKLADEKAVAKVRLPIAKKTG